ncbi:MAG TPA: VOC family protein [Bryobacteraceae bacterium]|nr:VOC family protein [Bryobacteraceae bacterium]
MGFLIDHVFICTSVGAPAADALVAFGLTEGTPNRHPGQGTANRRFFFENGMLELIWVENPEEAQSEQTRAMRLWERWSETGQGASPFGIILRPEPGPGEPCPFPSWEYRPPAMPELVLRVASETALSEPMWCLFDDVPTGRRRQPLGHAAGMRSITRVGLVCPGLGESSVTASIAARNIITLQPGDEHLLDVEFDAGKSGNRKDFRPDLPLVLRW